MTDTHDTEWRNFFAAMSEIAEADRAGQAITDPLDEIEAIAMHTEQPVLRRRARQVLDEAADKKRAWA